MIGEIVPDDGSPGLTPLDVDPNFRPSRLDDAIAALQDACVAYAEARGINATKRSALRAAGCVLYSRIRFAMAW